MTDDVFTEDDLLGRRDLRFGGITPAPQTATCTANHHCLTLSLPKRCNITPRNVHERFQTLLTPVLTLFTDFLSAVVTSEIAQILSLYGGGFLALKWQS